MNDLTALLLAMAVTAAAVLLFPDITWRILARLIEACPNDVVRRDIERFLQAVAA